MRKTSTALENAIIEKFGKVRKPKCSNVDSIAACTAVEARADVTLRSCWARRADIHVPATDRNKPAFARNRHKPGKQSARQHRGARNAILQASAI
ncbi:MAG: hypothetical protein V4793_10850, partial [Paraburkholderia tropica]